MACCESESSGPCRVIVLPIRAGSTSCICARCRRDTARSRQSWPGPSKRLDALLLRLELLSSGANPCLQRMRRVVNDALPHLVVPDQPVMVSGIVGEHLFEHLQQGLGE